MKLYFGPWRCRVQIETISSSECSTIWGHYLESSSPIYSSVRFAKFYTKCTESGDMTHFITEWQLTIYDLRSSIINCELISPDECISLPLELWSSDWCHLNYYVLCHLKTLFCKDGSFFMYSYIRFTKFDTKTKCHASGDMTRIITVTAHNSWPAVKRNKMSYHHTNGDVEFILMPYAVVHALPIITISISWNIDLEMAHQGMQMKF